LTNPKNIIAKTISPRYDNIEDRIRIAINYKDINSRIDFMLTRSFAIDLLSSLEEYIHKYYPDEDVYSQSEAFKENNNKFSKKITSVKQNDEVLKKRISRTNMEDFQLYKSTEDLLMSVKLNYNKETKHTKMVLISKENHKAVLDENIIIFKQIVESIKKSIPNIKWGIAINF